jgi:3-methyladenine DNA glycosylase AlkD
VDRLLSLALTEPWWDTIDSFAPSIFGPIALREKEVKEKMRELIYEEDRWKKRISILFQLKYKNLMDEEHLTEAIVHNLHTREFFVDKAIGWILREYAKTSETFVREFIEREDLSALSRREAGKHL